MATSISVTQFLTGIFFYWKKYGFPKSLDTIVLGCLRGFKTTQLSPNESWCREMPVSRKAARLICVVIFQSHLTWAKYGAKFSVFWARKILVPPSAPRYHNDVMLEGFEREKSLKIQAWRTQASQVREQFSSYEHLQQ